MIAIAKPTLFHRPKREMITIYEISAKFGILECNSDYKYLKATFFPWMISRDDINVHTLHSYNMNTISKDCRPVILLKRVHMNDSSADFNTLLNDMCSRLVYKVSSSLSSDLVCTLSALDVQVRLPGEDVVEICLSALVTYSSKLGKLTDDASKTKKDPSEVSNTSSEIRSTPSEMRGTPPLLHSASTRSPFSLELPSQSSIPVESSMSCEKEEMMIFQQMDTGEGSHQSTSSSVTGDVKERMIPSREGLPDKVADMKTATNPQPISTEVGMRAPLVPTTATASTNPDINNISCFSMQATTSQTLYSPLSLNAIPIFSDSSDSSLSKPNPVGLSSTISDNVVSGVPTASTARLPLKPSAEERELVQIPSTIPTGIADLFAPTHVFLTPLHTIDGYRVRRNRGMVALHFIRETWYEEEDKAGINNYTHKFLLEVLAIAKAHVKSIGGNALLSLKILPQETAEEDVNQAYSMITITGDAALMEEDPNFLQQGK